MTFWSWTTGMTVTPFLISFQRMRMMTMSSPHWPGFHSPTASCFGEEIGTPAASPPSSVMFNVCKCTTAQLDFPWPVAVVEAPRSHYEGKKLPLARSAMRQPLPIFPELLEELARYWTDCPYSNRSLRGKLRDHLQRVHVRIPGSAAESA